MDKQGQLPIDGNCDKCSNRLQCSSRCIANIESGKSDLFHKAQVEIIHAMVRRNSE